MGEILMNERTMQSLVSMLKTHINEIFALKVKSVMQPRLILCLRSNLHPNPHPNPHIRSFFSKHYKLTINVNLVPPMCSDIRISQPQSFRGKSLSFLCT